MNDLFEDEAFAAELVIGTLDPAERAEAEDRRQRDPSFARFVGEWESRLSPLLAAMPDIEPSPQTIERLRAEIRRLQAARPESSSSANVVQMRRQISIWRYATAGSLAMAAALGLWIAQVEFTAPRQSQTYMAVLQQGSGSPLFLVSLDLAKRRMTVVRSAAATDAGKSFELWMIGADQSAPRSLGLLDAPAAMHPTLPDVDPGMISNATYAVTVEAKGGSPTGKPTSAPLYTGHLVTDPR